MGDSEAAKVQGFGRRAIERQPETIAWSGLGCLRSRRLGAGELGRVAVSLPRQVGLRRWAWGLEWCDFGGEAEVR